MNKKRLLLAGLLSLSTILFVGCNSKEKKEDSSNEYETEVVADSTEADLEDATTLEDEANESTNSVSSADIDAMLDSYESFMTEYLSYVKKIKNNDMSAMTEMAPLMEKGQEWANKMDNMKGEMTAKQMTRMTKIIGKINEAMVELH